MKKLVRITTVPESLTSLLTGQLQFMNQYFEVIAVSRYGEDLEYLRNNEGIRIKSVDMTRTISPLKDLRATFNLYLFLKKEKPHIVHSHTPKAGIVGMLAAKFAGVPHRFHTVAGLPLLEASGPKRMLLNLVEKLTCSCATAVFPNSVLLKKIMIEEGFASEKKLKVIGKGSSNGINVNRFDSTLFSDADINKLKQQLNIKEGQFVFVFVGRLVTDKGINELVKAFELITLQHNTKLILVGSRENHLDPLLTETENTLKENKNIVQVGFQMDVRPYFALADVLVLPSYREGFPNVVLQAGAMNVPSIVTDINGCNEIIKDGENGLIIPVKDVNALVNAMNFMIQNSEIHETMRLKSREIIVNNYQHTYIWNELLKEYQKTEQG